MDTTIAPSTVTAGLLDITSWERLPAALRRSLATLARECGPTGIPAITTCFTWGGGWAYSAMVGKHEARTCVLLTGEHDARVHAGSLVGASGALGFPLPEWAQVL